MNRFLCHCFGILIAVSAIAKPTPPPAPKPDLSKVTAEDIRKTEEHRNQLIAQQKAELDAEKADHLKVSNALAQATGQLVTLQQQNDKLADTANAQAATIAKQNSALWWYRLHWWGAWALIGLSIAVFILTKFTKFGASIAARIP